MEQKQKLNQNENNNIDLPGRIDHFSIKDISSLPEESSIVLSFSKSSNNFIEMLIIKSHIFFDKRRPEIYMNPIRNIYGISLHSNCLICKCWLMKCIEGNREIMEKLSEILYSGKNPLLMIFSPYLRRLIFCSDIVDRKAMNKTIIKKVMSNCGNLFVSARVALSQRNFELINYFKEITNYSWYNMNDSNFAFSRCSIFLNFVNSKDIFLIKGIFPKKIYLQIFQICSEIIQKYSNRKYNRINNCNNLKENYLITDQDNSSFQKLNNIKDDNMLNLKEEETDLNLDNCLKYGNNRYFRDEPIKFSDNNKKEIDIKMKINLRENKNIQERSFSLNRKEKIGKINSHEFNNRYLNNKRNVNFM